MPRPSATDIVELLPWALQRETERYLASIRVNARETFRAADVEYSRERLELLLLFAAIQKLWATVNSQAWIVNHSLELLERTQGAGDGGNAPATGLRLGRSTYTRASPRYGQLVRCG